MKINYNVSVSRCFAPFPTVAGVDWRAGSSNFPHFVAGCPALLFLSRFTPDAGDGVSLFRAIMAER